MSLSKKIRKLLVNPKLFYTDSSVFKLINFVKVTYRQPRIEYNKTEDALSDDIVFIICNAISNNANGVTAFIYNHLPRRICFLKENTIHVIRVVVDILFDNDVKVSILYKGRFCTVRSRFRAIVLLTKKTFNTIRLEDRLGRESFFELEGWTIEGLSIRSTDKNLISTKIDLKHARDMKLFDLNSINLLNQVLCYPHEDEVSFDIDVVYTWVNSQDEKWMKQYNEYKRKISQNDSTSLARFENRNELKYSLRSIDLYAPWVRKIYIVSNCAPPDWLRFSDRIAWVYHEELFDSEVLPLFNSHAIETKLHKIKGLSKFFLYFNDDFFLTKPVRKNDFFDSNGLSKINFERWGNVNGEPDIAKPDYLNAAINGQRWLESKFGVSVTQFHCHSPYPLRTDLLSELENECKEHFVKTGSTRFRGITDISAVSFLYHHYAYLVQKGYKVHSNSLLIQSRQNYVATFERLLGAKEEANLHERVVSICINDGYNSHLDRDWNHSVISFLKSYFIKKSKFEN